MYFCTCLIYPNFTLKIITKQPVFRLDTNKLRNSEDLCFSRHLVGFIQRNFAVHKKAGTENIIKELTEGCIRISCYPFTIDQNPFSSLF